MKAAMHLAEFNIGTLRYDWDDPRAADFADNLDRVNAVAQRSKGFVWQLPEEADGGRVARSRRAFGWEPADGFDPFGLERC